VNKKLNALVTAFISETEGKQIMFARRRNG